MEEKKEEIPKMEGKGKIEKVTKEKNPGRIAAGKRLAERNRLKRLELKNKEHKEKIITQEEEIEKEEVKEKPREINISDKKIKTSDIVYLVLAGMIGGGIYIYQKWKTNKKTKEVKIEPEKPDPFYME